MTLHVEWYCPYCEQRILDNREALDDHIRTKHKDVAAPWHLEEPMPSDHPGYTPPTTDKGA